MPRARARSSATYLHRPSPFGNTGPNGAAPCKRGEPKASERKLRARRRKFSLQITYLPSFPTLGRGTADGLAVIEIDLAISTNAPRNSRLQVLQPLLIQAAFLLEALLIQAAFVFQFELQRLDLSFLF